MTGYAGWSHPTYDEGGVLPTGLVTVVNTSGKPIPCATSEQVERGLAWIRDHYRDGTFHCPSGDETTGG
jgi:hypothetical protein